MEKTMAKQYRLGALGAVVALMTVALLGVRNTSRAQEEGLPVGSKPPAFQVTTLKGASLDPTKQPGKVVVLDFWATWCPPCRASIPVLQAMHEKYQSRGLLVVGVSSEAQKTVAPFVSQNKMTYTLVADPGVRAAAGKYKVRGIPTLVVLDKKGVIRMYEVGFDPSTSRKRLEAAIQKLLREQA